MWYNPVVELVNLRKKVPDFGDFFHYIRFFRDRGSKHFRGLFLLLRDFFDLFFLHYSRDILVVSDDRYLLARREHTVGAR